MWKVVGIYYILVATNTFQVIDMHTFDKPEECFLQAMSIMKDKEDPRNMACIPLHKEPKGDAT
jgi:hypothetical protein